MKTQIYALFFVSIMIFSYKGKAQCTTNVFNSNDGSSYLLPKYKNASTTCFQNSQIYDNGTTVGINTITPDAYSKLHINVTNTSPGGGTLRGLYITLPTTWTPNGAMTAITATGGQTNASGNVNGTFTATLGSTTSFSANGGLIAGVSGSGSVTKLNTGPYTGTTSNIVGISGGIACSNMTSSINSGSWGWVSGVSGSLSGTITSYPTLVKGAVSCVMGIDQINGSATTNSYTYAGHFRGRVYIGNGGPLASTSYYVQQVGTTHADYLLCVDGKIVARKMVTTAQNWADDELKKETSLNDLEKEELFAKDNSHLSDVPSEKEVLDNGIEMSEMFTTHMRKIEQLFKYSFKFNHSLKQLNEYVLQSKEENVSLKKENETMKAQLNSMQNQINDLQKKVNKLIEENK